MAFKMGQFPEDPHYKTDLHSKKKEEDQKKKTVSSRERWCSLTTLK